MRASGSPRRSLCVEHALATGPDGLCVLCKRVSVRPAAKRSSVMPIAESERSWGARIVTLLMGMAAFVSIGIALVFVFGLVELNTPAAQSSRGALVPATDRGAHSRAAQPDQHAAREAQERTEHAQAAQVEQAAPPEAQPAQPAQPAAQAEPPAEALRAQQTAEQDQRRRDMIEADQLARTLKRARSSVSIVMYSTSWCPSCKARERLSRRTGHRVRGA